MRDSNPGWILKMAFRNIRRHRVRSILTGLMLAGGCGLLSIALGLSYGDYGSMIEMFTGDRTGHVQLHAPGYREAPRIERTLDDWPALRRRLTTLRDVKEASPRVLSSALAFVGDRTTALRIVGIDLDLEPQVTRVREKVREGSFLESGDPNAVLLDRAVARTLSLAVGDEFALVTQGADGSVANDLFVVRGLMGGTDAASSRDCWMDIAAAQDFLSLDGRFHEVAVRGVHWERARRLAADAERVLGPGFEAASWQAVEEDFYRAMQVDRKGMWIMLIVVMVLVSMGVLNTVLMNVLERTREYGVLKALGVRRNGVFLLVVTEMGLLSLYSLIPGVLIGWAANLYLVTVGLRVPEPISVGGAVFERLTGSFHPDVFWIPAVLTVGTALLVSLIPAFRARGLTPVDALRDV